jgi:hypothetical protein
MNRGGKTVSNVALLEQFQTGCADSPKNRPPIARIARRYRSAPLPMGGQAGRVRAALILEFTSTP